MGLMGWYNNSKFPGEVGGQVSTNIVEDPKYDKYQIIFLGNVVASTG